MPVFPQSGPHYINLPWKTEGWFYGRRAHYLSFATVCSHQFTSSHPCFFEGCLNFSPGRSCVSNLSIPRRRECREKGMRLLRGKGSQLWQGGSSQSGIHICQPQEAMRCWSASEGFKVRLKEEPMLWQQGVRIDQRVVSDSIESILLLRHCPPSFPLKLI